MIHKVYTVYDSKAEAYLRPFFARSRGEALRMFEDTVNDPNSMFLRHASDFTLFEIGEWDDVDGGFSVYEAKVSLGVALEFVRNQEQSDTMFDFRKEQIGGTA